MALKSGMNAQIGYKTESAYGTYTAPTTFLPLVSESLTIDVDRLESAGIVAGQRVLRPTQWAGGNIKVAGQVQHELYQQNVGLLFNHMFGGVSTAGAGPYTHTCTPGDLTGKSLTVQVGRPDIGGTVRPHSFLGCKVASWELAAKAGEICTLGLDIVGQQISVLEALASASYNADLAPFTFAHASLTIGGTAVPVKEVTLSGDNGLDDDRYFIGSATPSEPLEAALREYTASLTADFEDNTHLLRYLLGTEAALVLTISASASESVTITTNVRFDGDLPQVSGRDILELPLKCKCVGSSDAAAITAVVVNGQSSVA